MRTANSSKYNTHAVFMHIMNTCVSAHTTRGKAVLARSQSDLAKCFNYVSKNHMTKTLLSASLVI